MVNRSMASCESTSSPSIKSVNHSKSDKSQQHLELRRMFATSLAIERFTDKLNRRSPINLRLVTLPVCKASVNRIHSLELFYNQSKLFRFLLRRGLPPIFLFLGTTTGLAWLLRRFYTQHRYLALNSLGVLYPAWRCWHLVKRLDTHGEPMEQLQECKSWLTYWILYGSLQVMDNWASDLLQFSPNYNIYKLAILYWAQSPHSNGANMLYRRVLQKPEDEEEDEQQQQQQQQQHQPDYYDPIPEQQHPKKYTPLFDGNDEELTLTIGHPEEDEDEGIQSFRIIDGYAPTLANNDQHNTPYDSSCSSSGDNSPNLPGYRASRNKSLDMTDTQQEQKQVFPILTPLEADIGW